MERSPFHFNAAGALLLAAGLVIGGYFIGDGISRVRVGPRTVTVKGLAEREVDADVAVWPIRFNVSAGDMGGLNVAFSGKLSAIKGFLSEAGIPDDNVHVGTPMITDLHTLYRGAPALPPERYMAEGTVTVRSEDVGLVKETMGRISELIEKGVALTDEKYRETSEFVFTSLNDIKPAMIEDATKNARMSALKFAEDSESELGSIRRATQGQISIRNRDSSTPEKKIVRVVTTIEYFLK